ncbi:hypothetical protein GGX14DRAFT_388134 [Mycena pura]|uniref:Uncharacterized protein n=1 Tax=Mycena pura TaxID=153505 RepID=A0AAD6YKT2_9AGAR|nr:hypothetical protein GGX14DRAFT_388134 [Mycena pura]
MALKFPSLRQKLPHKPPLRGRGTPPSPNCRRANHLVLRKFGSKIGPNLNRTEPNAAFGVQVQEVVEPNVAFGFSVRSILGKSSATKPRGSACGGSAVDWARKNMGDNIFNNIYNAYNNFPVGLLSMKKTSSVRRSNSVERRTEPVEPEPGVQVRRSEKFSLNRTEPNLRSTRTIALTKSVSWVLIDIDAVECSILSADDPFESIMVASLLRALDSGAHGLMVPATCPQPRMEIRTTERSCHQEIVVQARGPVNDAIVVAVQIEHPAGPGPTRYRRSTRQGIDAARDRRGKGSTHATSTFVRRPCAVIACESHNALLDRAKHEAVIARVLDATTKKIAGIFFLDKVNLPSLKVNR